MIVDSCQNLWRNSYERTFPFDIHHPRNQKIINNTLLKVQKKLEVEPGSEDDDAEKSDWETQAMKILLKNNQELVNSGWESYEGDQKSLVSLMKISNDDKERPHI